MALNANQASPVTANQYILIVRDTGYCLVGPFKSEAELNRWGKVYAGGPAGDTRWSGVILAEPDVAPPVFTPKAAATAELFFA
jgi:hypothetical protein